MLVNAFHVSQFLNFVLITSFESLKVVFHLYIVEYLFYSKSETKIISIIINEDGLR